MATGEINWGSVADWVSGIGSMSAVITALYLSNASQRIRLRALAGHRVAIGNGVPEVDLFLISATNVATRTTIVSSIGVRVGVFRRRHGIVKLFEKTAFSVGLPKTLNDGDTAQWGVEMGANFEWVRSLCSKFVETKWDVSTFRFVLYTSNGREHVFKPEPPLKELMLKAVRGELSDSAATKQ
jgi:hypothetical protein